jgi:hypothetical protein
VAVSIDPLPTLHPHLLRKDREQFVFVRWVPYIFTSENHRGALLRSSWAKPVYSSQTARTGQTRDFKIPLTGLLVVIGLILSDQVHVQSPAQGQTHHFGPLVRIAMRVSRALNQA